MASPSRTTGQSAKLAVLELSGVEIYEAEGSPAMAELREVVEAIWASRELLDGSPAFSTAGIDRVWMDLIM